MVDSATGGVLQPFPVPEPLEGKQLLVFIQSWIAPLTGIPDTSLVRPRWQPEPSNIPNAGDAWMAFGIVMRVPDTFPAIEHDGRDDGTSHLQRQEELRMLCSFYDLGSTGLADKYAALTRDNLAIPQNLEMLALNGFALGYIEGLTIAPTLLSSRWQYRVDLPIVLRRQVDRTYAVRNVESANGTIETDTGYHVPFEVIEE